MKSFRLSLGLLVILFFLGGSGNAASDSLILVKDGQSDFSLYVSPPASPQIAANIEVFRNYIRQSSGAGLPVVSDLSRTGHRVIFEIGASSDSNLNVGNLGRDGFRIRTEGGNLYLTAGTDYGLQNAVYTFLETYLGCRMFSPTVTVVPKRPTIVIPNIDDTQVPSITFRMEDFRNSTYNAWHKLNSNEDFGLFVHTFKILAPPEKYFAEHPEYFSLSMGKRTAAGQLCLSNPDVFRIVVDELRARMRAKPEAEFWSVSQNDTYLPCECAACRAIDSAEGSPSGSILAFVNRVADEFPDKTISTLAYQYSRSAPKHLKPRPNVNIMLCSIECNRSKPLVEDSTSASFVKDVEDWCRLTHNIFLWDYVIQYRNLVSPFPNLHVLQPNIQFFAKNGITSVFEQGLAVMHGEFAELRSYLIAKLLWNPYLNVDSVMDDFLGGFYGNAAPHIRQYIDTMQAALQASGEDLWIYGYPTASKNGYLSFGMIDTYNAIFDQAEAAVADDSVFLSRVWTARLPLQFAILEQAKVAGVGDWGAFTLDTDGRLRVRPDIESLLTTFVRRCKDADIPKLWEHGISPDEYYASTDRFLNESGKSHLALFKPVTLTPPASPKYHNGESSALTDGFKGWDDYHMHWLGFEGEDMEATVDLGSRQTIATIETDFLQDINSWVFMPLTVEFSLSDDGRNFRTVGTVADTIPADRGGVVIAPFNIRLEPCVAQYIRVRAVSLKTCPIWHKGAGGEAWIFIDEIAVR
ncbi:MAG: DUF4838 domain-containing protein [candidate division Zixibacteria bacterium]|nr:DUF4838 domain-containing protein [candidate division Zixibacteria bacterium]